VTYSLQLQAATMHFTAAKLIFGFAAIAYAYTQPAGANPSGNPIIHPGLGELIPAGTTYDITWTPTTQGALSSSRLEYRPPLFQLTITPPGNISLLLLRGPSTNVVPIETIVDSVANTGSYTWNVPSTLVPDTTHYGIELIVEGTGQYQYSPQCGVSNSAVSSSTSGNASTVTVVPATQSSTWGSSYSNSTWTSAGSANYSASILSASSSVTASSWSIASTSAVLSNTVVPSATATFQATPTASTVVSTGAAVANMARNAGAMMVAGIVGALAL
jgi:Ser-Thr-rich glycosyl-phosphatidyl-inositol-anchored membrane family